MHERLEPLLRHESYADFIQEHLMREAHLKYHQGFTAPLIIGDLKKFKAELEKEIGQLLEDEQLQEPQGNTAERSEARSPKEDQGSPGFGAWRTEQETTQALVKKGRRGRFSVRTLLITTSLAVLISWAGFNLWVRHLAGIEYQTLEADQIRHQNTPAFFDGARIQGPKMPRPVVLRRFLR